MRNNICKNNCTIIFVLISPQIAKPDPGASLVQSWLISMATNQYQAISIAPVNFVMPSPATGRETRSARHAQPPPRRVLPLRSRGAARRGNGPPIVDPDISIPRKWSRLKRKRGRNDTDANSETVSKRNHPPVNPGADNDPITSVDGLNNVHENVNHAKLKASITRMDNAGVSTAQSDTGLEKAHSITNTVTDSDRTTPEDGLNDDHKVATHANSKVSPIVINKVGADLNDDNDVAIAADGVNDTFNNDNNNAPDKDNDDVPMVSLYRHCPHLSPRCFLV